MKRLVFSKKYFVRRPDMDFDDDGAKFRLYYYKGVLPISVTRWNGFVFAAVRLDYLDIPFERWNDRETFKLTDEFNYVEDDKFDMDKLIANCEKLIEMYSIKAA